ncbi:MAG TPA: PAS domain S-box protein [Methanomicrobia archaeon]|nr:PAS domain S-box protein [Methanomicrobia archaeon]
MRHVECIDDCDSSTLRALFLNNGIALALFDRDLRLIDANAEFENIVNYDRGEYMFHAWKRMLDSSSMEKVQSFATMRFRDPRSAPSQYELTIVDGRGQKKHIIVNVSFISNRGASLVSITDITDIKRTQEDLKNRNEMLKELLERLYHDAQTPLVTLYSYSDLLCEAVKHEEKDQAHLYLKVIKDASISLSEVLRDMAIKGIHYPPSLTKKERK